MTGKYKNSSLPILDTRLINGTSAERRHFAESLTNACRHTGVFYITNPLFSSALCRDFLDAARSFFNLPFEEKEAVNICHSKHFRGYSQMKNERDWREQFHLGVELPEQNLDNSEYWKLQGSNLFPACLGDDWQNLMMSFMKEVGNLGHRLLAVIAAILKLPENYFELQAGGNPYLLMKLINYYPQISSQNNQSGVAAHCDWSWLTFLLQTEAGLQVKIRSGQWIDVPPVSDTMVVNIGELLGILTSGYFYAAPHRVVNNSSQKTRLSIPIFINPALPSLIEPLVHSNERPDIQTDESEHIHRVVQLSQTLTPFVFGDSEWQRKGLGRWCYRKECL